MSIPDDADALTRATRLLREHTDAGWTVLSPSILDRMMRVFRPSDPVRGRHAHGDYFVRCDVLTEQIRQAVDAVTGARAADITCVTGDREQLVEVTVEIAASYGTHLPTLAATVHDVTHRAVIDILGDLAPAATAVHSHVHVYDIRDDRPAGTAQ
ncbi:hypothetical protein [Actinoplanes subglobosus]|uniref:Uncharacterized protein n=1 Tax=Actinoplanes subglobosus TaxID=1547892 RepID=A0ABV8J8T4_9ACTN